MLFLLEKVGKLTCTLSQYRDVCFHRQCYNFVSFFSPFMCILIPKQLYDNMLKRTLPNFGIGFYLFFSHHTVTPLEIEDHSHVYAPEERTVSSPSPPLSSSRHQQQQQRESNYTPVYNYNGYQLPPRMAQQQQQNSGGGGGGRQQGTGAQHSGRQSTQQHKQEWVSVVASWRSVSTSHFCSTSPTNRIGYKATLVMYTLNQWLVCIDPPSTLAFCCVHWFCLLFIVLLFLRTWNRWCMCMHTNTPTYTVICLITLCFCVWSPCLCCAQGSRWCQYWRKGSLGWQHQLRCHQRGSHQEAIPTVSHNFLDNCVILRHLPPMPLSRC